MQLVVIEVAEQSLNSNKLTYSPLKTVNYPINDGFKGSNHVLYQCTVFMFWGVRDQKGVFSPSVAKAAKE